MLCDFEYSFEGFIFDCDGTLAESMQMHFRAWQAALALQNATFDFTWELFRSMAGMGLHHTVDLVNKRFKQNLEPISLLKSQEEFSEKHIHEMRPNYEILNFATWVAEKGYARSVASGGNRHVVHRTLKIIGADHLFPIVVTQDDVTHGKPDPEIFLLAAKKMGIAPEKCLVLEDSMLGIQAAKAAGMGALLVRFD
jgi:HAD superfamily hydrolase (TIGR01509 family)